ncbi:TetR/AcrR family transcriptional regulator [Mycobacterium marinum]|uniref:TetR/AcrR family transcriptional regulator n=1 Tax=Mycobacterium marinum TaxID=1781 RepID=UPI00356242C1
MSGETIRRSPTADRILQAAAERIATRGYAATSTREIAASVGIEQPAIYKHFSSKRDILAALVRVALERPIELIDVLAGVQGPAVVKLCRWLLESFEYLNSFPNVLASIIITPELQEEPFADEQALVSKFEPAIVDLIERAQDEGDVRELNPVSAARLIQAMFDAVAFPALAVNPDEIVEFALTALLEDPSRLPEIRLAAAALNTDGVPLSGDAKQA